jgi:hypothetical protein
MTNEQSIKAAPARFGRMRFTFIFVALSLVLLVVSMIYAGWAREQERGANMPVPAMETIALALRTFHQQTGRFPRDFRELDERVWRGERRAQISPDGKSLVAPQSRYYYTLHSVNPPNPASATQPVKAGIWAVPTGERAQEAATYFWYVTPRDIERWMGPALTRENIGAINSIPSENQLALLVMIRQPPGSIPTQSSSKGIFSLLGF